MMNMTCRLCVGTRLPGLRSSVPEPSVSDVPSSVRNKRFSIAFCRLSKRSFKFWLVQFLIERSGSY